jgi:hypothetical protein
MMESCQPDWRDWKGIELGNKFRPDSFLDFLKKGQNTKKNSPDFVCLLLHSGFDFLMEEIAS